MDTLHDAFAPYRSHSCFYTGVEALADNNPSLSKVVNEIMEGTRRSHQEHKVRLTEEHRALDPTKKQETKGGDIFVTEPRESMFKLDTAADASICKPGAIASDALKEEKKVWSGIGDQPFHTTHSGMAQGNVDWNRKERGTGKRQSGKCPMEFKGHVSRDAKQNLLGLESLIESDEWQFATFQLTRDGQSYLYGREGRRVPLHRIEGRTGWWLKVYHGECKSQVCSRIYGLIHVQLGTGTKRRGPLDSVETCTIHPVVVKDQISMKPFTPYDRSNNLKGFH